MIRSRQLRAWLALVLLAGGNITCSDLLSAPGASAVTVAYSGSPTIVLGTAIPVAATATANGSAIVGAGFRMVSSDSSIVRVDGDSLRGLRIGSATVTVSLTGSILPSDPPSASQLVTVVPGAITLDSTSVTFASLGDTIRMGVSVLDGAQQPVVGAPITWLSTDTSRVDVSATGKITAKRNGSSLVIATSSGISDTVTVVVAQVLTHFTFNVPGVALNALSQTATVTATPRDARNNGIASGAAPSYAVVDASVASVGITNGVVTALLNGATFVVALRGTVRDSVPLLVDQKAKTVTVSPKPVPALTSIADQVQLNGTAVDTNNISVQGATPAWSSSNTAAVSVSASGLVTAVGVGQSYVVASLDGKRDSVLITVTNNPAVVTVIPDTATATSINDTLVFTATVLNARGDPLASPVPTWHTPNTDTAVVTVLSDGRVIAKRTGAARIIAQAGSRADTGIAIVTNVPATVDLVPVSRTLTALGDNDIPGIVILNARGDTLPRNAVTWASDDPAVARVTALGVVTAVDTGTTIIRASFGTFITDSTIYTITNDPFSIVITVPPRAAPSGATSGDRDTLTDIGQVFAMTVDVRNRRNQIIVGYQATWVSTDRTVVDTVDHDVAVSTGFGTTRLIATAGSVADTVIMTVRNLSRLTVDNSVVAQVRVGTTLRPFASIQDAVDAADANDTVLVRRGTGTYRETVALTKRLFLLGDSTAFTANRNPLLLPGIAHDTGAAAITAYTSAPQTVRYLVVRHTLDGPAFDGNGADVILDNFYVNPPGSGVTSRIGRGIQIRGSLSGTRVTNSIIDSVRGYAVRLEGTSNALLRGNQFIGIDSIPFAEEGAGVKIVSGNANRVSNTIIRNAQVGVLVAGGTNARVDTSIILRNTVGLRFASGSVAGLQLNDIFDNDSIGVDNQLGGNVTILQTWYGDNRGPRRAADPAATGDTILGAVTFLPVRTSPALIPGVNANGLRRVRGDGQSATAGTALPFAFTVRVTDGGGMPVANANVTFSVTGGGGNIGGQANDAVTTNGSGLAEATLTLGSAPGNNVVVVTLFVNGNPVQVTFTATGT